MDMNGQRNFLLLLLPVVYFMMRCALVNGLHPGSIHLEPVIGMLMVVVLAAIFFRSEKVRNSRIMVAIKQGLAEHGIVMPEKPAGNEGTKVVSVLFTRNHDFYSDVIFWLSGRRFSHASLGLGEQTDEFFSFDYRGMRREHPGHRKIKENRTKESLCCQFKVTESEYRRVESVINEFLKEQQSFRYNLSGLIFCMLHIRMPLKARKTYFCSEFVSEQLHKLESFKLKKPANMYMPTNLSKALVRQKNLYRVLVDEV